MSCYNKVCPTLTCFYTDFKENQITAVRDFLEFVANNKALQKASINMVCLNSHPTEHSAALVEKYSSIADFWAAGAAAKAAIVDLNVEEPNYVIVADMNGKIDYVGNLFDSECRVNYGKVIDKGSSKKPLGSFLYNSSLYSKYLRKYDKKAPPEK